MIEFRYYSDWDCGSHQPHHSIFFIYKQMPNISLNRNHPGTGWFPLSSYEAKNTVILHSIFNHVHSDKGIQQQMLKTRAQVLWLGGTFDFHQHSDVTF